MKEIQVTQVWSLDWEDSSGEGHGNLLQYPCWRIPWTEQPGALQSLGLHRVGQDWSDLASLLAWCWVLPPVMWETATWSSDGEATCPFWVPGGSDGKESACNAEDRGSMSGSVRTPGEGNGNSLHYSCLENPMDGGAW